MGAALSVVMPVLNEAPAIEAALARLQPLRRRGAEVIVAAGTAPARSPRCMPIGCSAAPPAAPCR
jgi:hypothetical protein